MSEKEPKIIVDDDWKSQVEKEKEQLDEPAPAEGQGGSEGAEDQGESPQLPEASFSMLVTTLAMQASVALGQMPDPMTGQPAIQKPIAKHYIDLLAMLQEKTKGNLDKEEADLIESAVHQLRMAFVMVPDTMPEAEEKKSSIELP